MTIDKYSTKLLPILVLVLICSGCATRHGDFTVVSNKLVRTSNFDIGSVERKKNITGEDVQHVIIFFPTSGPPTLEGAIDDAMEKGDGDVMTDAVIKSWWFYIPYIYGKSGWSIKGDVVKTRK
ncbi:MAG: hypothetical protein K8I00_08100 [Candidatus Omnitrophica bacterium]|nr:hypothetical protein [Candidatus Omnitrophota bacterium]